MTGDRSEAAVQRIEAALARIARVADSPPPTRIAATSTPSVTALVEQHEALRETVSRAIAELDSLIAELDQ
jgi:hypothetical protein